MEKEEKELLSYVLTSVKDVKELCMFSYGIVMCNHVLKVTDTKRIEVKFDLSMYSKVRNTISARLAKMNNLSKVGRLITKDKESELVLQIYENKQPLGNFECQVFFLPVPNYHIQTASGLESYNAVRVASSIAESISDHLVMGKLCLEYVSKCLKTVNGTLHTVAVEVAYELAFGYGYTYNDIQKFYYSLSNSTEFAMFIACVCFIMQELK